MTRPARASFRSLEVRMQPSMARWLDVLAATLP
jgi:hypothetical protein